MSDAITENAISDTTSPAKHASFSVVIATKDRPKELRECITSILRQAIRPGEIVIVDSGSPGNRKMSRENIHAIGKRNHLILYLETNRQSTPYQRNIGIDHVTGDIVFFFDDDVVLLEGFFEEMLGIYHQWGDSIAGLQGVARNLKQPGRLSQLSTTLFLPGSLFSKYAQGMDMAGFSFTKKDHRRRLQPAQWLVGYCMSFRKEVFEQHRFDDKLEGYALSEDVDFSYRISRKFPLYRLMNANIRHRWSPVNRLNDEAQAEMWVINQNYLFRKNFTQGFFNTLLHVWGLFGRMCVFFVKGLLHNDLSALRGFFKGIKKIIL